MDKKFILVNDEHVAMSMISSGFKLVSQIGNQYTFLNQCPKGFSFSELDKTKLCFSNIILM